MRGIVMPRIHLILKDTYRISLYLSGLVIFLTYLFFLSPSLYSGDSPLLYTSVFAMGTAHPPGYPLYVLLGKISTFLPFGSIPYKLNLFSAICGVAASAVVFMSVHLLTKDIPTAIFSAILSGFLPLAWSESVKAEVYTLNSVLMLVIFYLGIRFISENGDRRLLFLGSFILGIGMGNHHTIGFMIFPLMFLLALNKQNRVSTIFISVLFFMLGFSVYIFSYVRSLKYFSDGILFSYSDSSSFRRFLITFFREEYGSSIPAIAGPASHPTSLLQGPYNAVRHLIFENMGWLSVLAILSIVPLWKRRKSLLFYFLMALASYGIILSAMVYSFEEPVEKDLFLLSPYMLPLLYLVTINIGCGLWELLKPVKRRFLFTIKPFAVGMILLPFVLYLPVNIKKNNLSNYYLVEDFAGNMLNALPPLSIVLASSDAAYFPLFYKNLIERKRDDVVVLLSDKGGVLSQANPFWKYKTLFPDLPAGKLFSKVDEAYVKRGRVFTPNVLSLSDKLKKYFTPHPYIMCYRLFPKGQSIDEKQKLKDLSEAFERFVYERTLKEKADDMFSTEVKMYYFTSLTHYVYLLKKQGLPYRDYYETSLELITPKGLVYYMEFLKQVGDKEEIESFIESIEPYAQQYPEVRLLSTALKEEFLGGY